MNLVEVSGLSRREGELYTLRDVSFTQPQFWKLGIVGAAGSGKTTLLQMIAGFLQPSSGTILWNGKKLTGPDENLMPGHPRIAYLSQYFELRHHHQIRDILEKANELSEEEASIIYSACRIAHLVDRTEDQLSGGEKQRVALARLLVAAPGLLLLDEPFSNLDVLHKNILKSVIREVGDTLKISCIIVSHDPLDILSWADEIIVLKDGMVVQKGSPVQIYHQPLSEYTAALFGKYNILSPSLAKAFSTVSDLEMNRINSFIRPEAFALVEDESTGLKGEVVEALFMGAYQELHLVVAGHLVVVHSYLPHIRKGDLLYVSLKDS